MSRTRVVSFAMVLALLSIASPTFGIGPTIVANGLTEPPPPSIGPTIVANGLTDPPPNIGPTIVAGGITAWLSSLWGWFDVLFEVGTLGSNR